MITGMDLAQALKEAHTLITQAALKIGGVQALAGVGRCLTSELATVLDRLGRRSREIAKLSQEIEVCDGPDLARALEGCEREDLLERAEDLATDFVQIKQSQDDGEACEAEELKRAQLESSQALAEVEEVPAHLWTLAQKTKIALLEADHAATARAIREGVTLAAVNAAEASLDAFVSSVDELNAAVGKDPQSLSPEDIARLIEQVEALSQVPQIEPKLLGPRDMERLARAQSALRVLDVTLRAVGRAQAKGYAPLIAPEVEAWLSDLEASVTRTLEREAGSSRLLSKQLKAWEHARDTKAHGIDEPYHSRFWALGTKIREALAALVMN